METPVLFLFFNRPTTTRRVFSQLKKVKPTRLFISADGPRPDQPRERYLCTEVKEITERIDWTCEVRRLYRSDHLGCKLAVCTAITWFFDQVDAGIILEDDCLPSLDFFSFCTTMLTDYKDDPNIFHITGNNFQHGMLRGKGSYYYSKYAHIWGWASWKRAWQHYDLELQHWDVFKTSPTYDSLFLTREEKKFWTKKFEKYQSQNGNHNYWSLQWQYACWFHGGWTITPHKNLVTNIGFGSGTHTTVILKHLILKLEVLPPPYPGPAHRELDQIADAYTFKNTFQYKGTIWSRIRYHILRLLNNISK